MLYFGSIGKYDSGGNFISTFASTGFCSGLAFDNSGYLYAANSYRNDIRPSTIMKFDSSGNGSVFADASSGLGNNPRGLAFDSSGNLYAANPDIGTIEKFDSNGNGTLFASGLSNPAFIAIQVPEPATWSLLALGIGVLLGGCRMRRRS